MTEMWQFDRALTLIQRSTAGLSSPTGKRILEVGVGRGSFLEQARGIGIEAEGVEISPEAAVMARAKGFQIHEESLAHLASQSFRPWDAICSFQVLQHLAEPRTSLEQAVALLKPGGLLILSVPIAAVAARIDSECTNLLNQPPRIMSHWDEGVTRYLEEILPLEIRTIEFEPLADCHIGWFAGAWVSQIQRRLGRPLCRLILNRFTIQLLHHSLRLVLRYLVRGHTLLVCWQKRPER